MPVVKAARSMVLKSDALNARWRSYLRFVEPNDAPFVSALRRDTTLNEHLSPSVPDVAAQREWIVRYKERESCGTEFYFVIVSEGRERGLVRMYHLDPNDASFSWGSWIIPPPRSPGLVTFSALTIYEIGFDVLGLERSFFTVSRENVRVSAFHLRAGATQIGEDAESFFYTYTRPAYAKFRKDSTAQIAQHRIPAIPARAGVRA
jgi:RimJ/RimL family protein N-acetyltransferase